MIPLQNVVSVQTIDNADWLTRKQLSLDVLRLDLIHPVVSGNKWFKLKHYLEDAISQQKTTLATFGGAWSNHIVATAFATKEAGLKSVGIIRGERPAVLSKTLLLAESYGMQLRFVTREAYRNKEALIEAFDQDWYCVHEGGYGIKGALGAAEILRTVPTSSYTHIIAAIGTGTTVAGLLTSALPHQTIIGISSMKGNTAIVDTITNLVGGNIIPALQILHEYHFGGYGKHPQTLIDFINDIYWEYELPLDIVYTGKTFFAIKDLVEKDFFAPGSRLLMIHSGGLQGNSSLPPKVLAF